jgi:hypothetical protein
VLGQEWVPVLLKADIAELLTVQRIKHVRGLGIIGCFDDDLVLIVMQCG